MALSISGECGEQNPNLRSGYRSLKLWMVMRMYGSTGLRAYIRNHCDIAKHFEELLRTDSRFEVTLVYQLMERLEHL